MRLPPKRGREARRTVGPGTPASSHQWIIEIVKLSTFGNIDNGNVKVPWAGEILVNSRVVIDAQENFARHRLASQIP